MVIVGSAFVSVAGRVLGLAFVGVFAICCVRFRFEYSLSWFTYGIGLLCG